jgi:hypothetical protein
LLSTLIWVRRICRRQPASDLWMTGMTWLATSRSLSKFLLPSTPYQWVSENDFWMLMMHINYSENEWWV